MHMKTAVISGADRNIGLELARQFLQRGWRVFAGRYLMELPLLEQLQAEYPEHLTLIPLDVSSETSVNAAAQAVSQQTDHVDLLVHTAAAFGVGRNADGEFDFSSFLIPSPVNALGAMRMVHAFLPLMRTGMKRLCFVSSEAGAVSVAHRTEISSYCMSKTALNMALRLMFNQLQPLGYTFRLYHPGWVRSPKIERSTDKAPTFRDADGNLIGKFWPWETAASAVPQFLEDRECEDRLVLIDNEGAAWPF